MPPACAMAMARPASVTVSMAADTSGIPNSTVLVRRVRVSTWPGRTSEAPGTSNTSSKVKASRMVELVIRGAPGHKWGAPGGALYGAPSLYQRPLSYARGSNAPFLRHCNILIYSFFRELRTPYGVVLRDPVIPPSPLFPKGAKL